MLVCTVQNAPRQPARRPPGRDGERGQQEAPFAPTNEALGAALADAAFRAELPTRTDTRQLYQCWWPAEHRKGRSPEEKRPVWGYPLRSDDTLILHYHPCSVELPLALSRCIGLLHRCKLKCRWPTFTAGVLRQP